MALTAVDWEMTFCTMPQLAANNECVIFMHLKCEEWIVG